MYALHIRHAQEKTFILDDNGITGPDWGRSEVVAVCSCKDAHTLLTPENASLSAALCRPLVSSTLFIILCIKNCSYASFLIQQNLYFFPLPQGHGSFLPIFFPTTTVPDFFCSRYSRFLVSSS